MWLNVAGLACSDQLVAINQLTNDVVHTIRFQDVRSAARQSHVRADVRAVPQLPWAHQVARPVRLASDPLNHSVFLFSESNIFEVRT